MKYFLAVLEDRHIDPVYALFTKKDDAINWCKMQIEDEEEIEEEDGLGCIYYATYSCEGDHVHVEEIELDKETAE